MSAIKPYRSDPIINFSVRYQSTATTIKGITRAFLLSTLLMGGGSTTSFRPLSGVRVNSITLTTSTNASIQWLSQYAPTSETTVTGTSTTSPGVYISRPPKNSTASFWSQSFFNESELLVNIGVTVNDYIDVSFSAVFMDDESVASVTTHNSSTNGQLYRSYLDGPLSAGSCNFVPVNLAGIQ
jgi:hypothetical protein